MLYLALPAHNEADTIGVLLWRIRTVLAEFPREYEVVVYDDASTDVTREVLASYTQVMPLTVLHGDRQVGYARALDALARHVVRQTRYPRRDAVLFLQGDFTDPPGLVPEFARRFEGGADLVVGERATVSDAPVPVRRLFKGAGWALRPFVGARGVRDLTSSMRLARLSLVRELLRQRGDAPLCSGDTVTANADLVLDLVPLARRVESVPVEPTYGVRMRDTRHVALRDTLAALRWAWRARGRRVAPTGAADATDQERPRGDGRRGEGRRDESRRDAGRGEAPRRERGPERRRDREDVRAAGGAEAPVASREAVLQGATDRAADGARRHERDRGPGRGRNGERGRGRERTGPQRATGPEPRAEPRAEPAAQPGDLAPSAGERKPRPERPARRERQQPPQGAALAEPGVTTSAPSAPVRPSAMASPMLDDPFARRTRRDPFARLDEALGPTTAPPAGGPGTPQAGTSAERPEPAALPGVGAPGAGTFAPGEGEPGAAESGAHAEDAEDAEAPGSPAAEERRKRRRRGRRGRGRTRSGETGGARADGSSDDLDDRRDIVSDGFGSDRHDSRDDGRDDSVRVAGTDTAPPLGPSGDEVPGAEGGDESRDGSETPGTPGLGRRRLGRRGRRGGTRRSRRDRADGSGTDEAGRRSDGRSDDDASPPAAGPPSAPGDPS